MRVAGLDHVVAAAAGGLRPNVAVRADGSVWSWADSLNPAPTAMEGLGPITAIAVGAQLAGAVAADGTVWVLSFTFSFSGSTAEPPKQVDDLNDIVALAMGGESTLALKADGTVWDWNAYGH